MYPISVKLENEEEISELRKSAAELMPDVDPIKLNNTVLVRMSLRLSKAFLQAVKENVEPSSWKTFLICFASKKGWFKNYNWKQSKREAATEEISLLVMDAMMKILQDKSLLDEQEGEMIEERIGGESV